MNRRGVNLIELLIAIVISTISFFSIALPFVTERSFARQGRRQVEAQRDAQVAMRAIARAGRDGTAYDFDSPPNPAVKFHKASCSTGTVNFVGDLSTGKLFLIDECAAPPATVVLIDGVRSQLTDMVVTSLVPNKLVRVRLEVTYQGEKVEVLETELFLRNAS